MFQRLEVGRQYPGWKGTHQGTYLSIVTVGLQLLLSLSGLTKREISDFEKLRRYGIYATEEFPHGIILWECDNEFIIETTFNLEKEKAVRWEETEAFLKEGWNSLARILTDESGIIKSFIRSELDRNFIAELINIWSGRTIDWGEYDNKLKTVMNNSTKTLWEESEKYGEV